MKYLPAHLWYFDSDNTYYCEIATLPGCMIQGNDINECIFKITECLTGLLETYDAFGSDIPWRSYDDYICSSDMWLLLNIRVPEHLLSLCSSD